MFSTQTAATITTSHSPLNETLPLCFVKWSTGSNPYGVINVQHSSVNLRRIQRVFWRHVDIAIVDITQHGVKGLLTRNHFTNGDVNLTILRHEGAKHGLKVTAEPQIQL